MCKKLDKIKKWKIPNRLRLDLNFFSNLFDKVHGFEPFVSYHIIWAFDADGQVFCHESVLNSLDDWSFQGFDEILQFLVLVELGPVKGTSSPSENTGNEIGGSLLALVMHSVMFGDNAIGGFCLNRSVWGQQY